MKKVFIIVLCTLLLAACGEEDNITNKESLESEELVENNSIEDVYDRTTSYAGQTFYKIDDQCFSLNMNPLGNIDFKAYEPAEGTADSDILLEIWRDGEVIMKSTDPLEPTFSNDKVELEVVVVDMVDDTIDSAKESARKYIGMISNED